MNSQALAVLSTAPGAFSVSRIDIGEVGEHDVLIRTLYTGVSTGTDKWVMQGRFVWEDSTFPRVAGYQRSGVVQALGSGVTRFHVGQLVAATASEHLVGVNALWGGHVSLASSADHEVFAADGISPIASALLVSAQVGVNAASRISAQEGSRVLVIGDGIIGASGALAASARGYDVLLVGRHEERLERVRDHGIHTLNSASDDLARIADWEPRSAIDTVHSDESFSYYIDAIPERTGEIVFSGHSPDGVTAWVDMAQLAKRELTAHFVSGWTPERLKATLELMRTGKLPVETLVGTVATKVSEVESLMTSVVEGQVKPVAAVIDWRELGSGTPPN